MNPRPPRRCRGTARRTSGGRGRSVPARHRCSGPGHAHWLNEKPSQLADARDALHASGGRQQPLPVHGMRHHVHKPSGVGATGLQRIRAMKRKITKRPCQHCDPRHPYGGQVSHFIDAAFCGHFLCPVHATAMGLIFYEDNIEIAEALVVEGLPARVLPWVPQR